MVAKDTRVIRKVPQGETKSWVCSFFEEKNTIKSLLAHHVSKPILKFGYKFCDFLYSPLHNIV